ncbi:MAG: hypothetical protein KKG60_01645 [Nanoarchaeota archaeon]|nr:hypothetical protein [Nanoarchaeota archaeon]
MVDMENKSIFLKVFGDYPLNKVMDFLITYEDFDYPMKEIAVKSGVGYSTLKLFWKHLVKFGIVKHTRDIGNAKLFKLNVENQIVKKFSKFYLDLAKVETEKYLGNNVARVRT